MIYRESQLRKAEAVAAAKRNKKTSTSSTHHHRTPTGQVDILNQDNSLMVTTESHKSLKRKRASLTEEDGQIPKKVRRGGRHRKICTTDGCTNVVVKGGVCIRHGAEIKQCCFYSPAVLLKLATKTTLVLTSTETPARVTIVQK